MTIDTSEAVAWALLATTLTWRAAYASGAGRMARAMSGVPHRSPVEKLAEARRRRAEAKRPVTRADMVEIFGTAKKVSPEEFAEKVAEAAAVAARPGVDVSAAGGQYL